MAWVLFYELISSKSIRNNLGGIRSKKSAKMPLFWFLISRNINLSLAFAILADEKHKLSQTGFKEIHTCVYIMCEYFEILFMIFHRWIAILNRFHIVIYRYSLWGPFENRNLKAEEKKGQGLIDNWYCQLKNLATDIFSSAKK